MELLTPCTWTRWEVKAPFSAFHSSGLSSSWVPCWSSVRWNNLRMDQAEDQHHSTRYQHLRSRHMLLQWMKHVQMRSLITATECDIYGYSWLKLTDNDKQNIPYITVVSQWSFVCGGFLVKISVLTIHSPSMHIHVYSLRHFFPNCEQQSTYNWTPYNLHSWHFTAK